MGESHLVLIIEDDDAISESLAEALEDNGFATRRAPNGQAALALLRGGLEVCLILMDMMMPVMNGWDLYNELQRDHVLARIPVCIVTAYASTKPMPTGAITVMPKPLRLDRLLGIVEEHC